MEAKSKEDTKPYQIQNEAKKRGKRVAWLETSSEFGGEKVLEPTTIRD